MWLSLRHWRPRHLLLAWLAYWILALLIALRSALGPILRVTGDPNAHGSINAGFTNGVFTLAVSDATGVIWQGSASITSIVLWAAGPPLLLFLLWLSVRPRVAEPVFSSPPQR